MIKNIQKAINKYWGYDSFLPLQEQAMSCISSNRDSVVVLPTGGGKSLCFQGPAVTMDGLAVVVSPLISLMKDQVDSLNDCGVSAMRLDSTLSPAQRDEVIARIDDGSLKLLYLSPERVISSGFIGYLRTKKLSFVAIDEAH